MHLYIHIPFCESKCAYCSFTSLKKQDYEENYIKALIKDIKFQIENNDIKSIKTIFIGGGTPSIIDVKFYEKIFIYLENFIQKNAEISIEANPNSTNLNWLKNIKNLGINRISFGAQSFNEEKLKFLKRIHDKNAIFKSVENANKAEFKNINIDLIYDSKLDNKKMLDFECENLSKLNISHVSAYNLTIEEKTAFAKKHHYKKNAPRLAKYFIDKISDLGYRQYEISNFGKICKHNLAYWQGKEYIGCGLSAVGFLNNKRFYTKKSLKEYINNPNFREIEKLTKKDINFEKIFLGLRSCVGIKKQDLNEKQSKKALFLVNKKKLLLKNDTFYNTNYLLSDEIALYLDL